jgi:hypothetical protein
MQVLTFGRGGVTGDRERLALKAGPRGRRGSGAVIDSGRSRPGHARIDRY